MRGVSMTHSHPPPRSANPQTHLASPRPGRNLPARLRRNFRLATRLDTSKLDAGFTSQRGKLQLAKAAGDTTKDVQRLDVLRSRRALVELGKVACPPVTCVCVCVSSLGLCQRGTTPCSGLLLIRDKPILLKSASLEPARKDRPCIASQSKTREVDNR